MIEDAKKWEGQLLNGKFLLRRFLGGSDRSAVFLVEESAGGQPQAAIRLVDAKAAGAADQLQQWEAASKLNHANLIRIFETGHCQVAGHELLYARTEFAEENLAQILPERALTADEARQVVEAVLAALAYIHREGFVHGSLKPSNIFAVGNTVKVSSDTIRPAGKAVVGRSANPAYDAPEVLTGAVAPSADVWSLGITLAEVLTQRLPILDSRQKPTLAREIAEPFQEIVENCLQVDPAKRWTIAQISARLSGKETRAVHPASDRPVAQNPTRASSSIMPGKKQSAKWPYAIALVVAVVLVAMLIIRPRPPVPEPAAQPASGEASTAASPPAVAEPAQDCCAGRVAKRERPAVSAGALRTIQGKIRVQVDVDVDEKGDVTEARLKSAGPSRYFAGKSHEAARRWKFKPPVENGQAVASQWRVKFTLSRRGIDDSAEQIRP